MKKRPSFWPENPYPESIFTMTLKGYVKAVPDPGLRTAISGALGRHFWQLADDEIYKAWKDNAEIPGQLDICKTCAAKKLFDESLE